MKIGFLCDINLPNYTTHPEAYAYLHGRHSATGYYYWILKNHGVNVELVSPDNDLTHYDIIVFHYDNASVLDLNAYKTIQVVTDRPYIENASLYVAANSSVLEPTRNIDVIKTYGIENTLNTWVKDKSKWCFIHYPPTFNVKQCSPTFPPKRYKFVGRVHTMIPELLKQSYINKCSKYGINLVFDFVNDNNTGDEDVYFCVRCPYYSGKMTGLESNSGKHGHRTANRLYQAWYMNTPGIFNMSPEMAGLRKTELDFLIANNENEFLEQALRLKNDKDLFYGMVENSKNNLYNNPYHDITIVVEQWKKALSRF